MSEKVMKVGVIGAGVIANGHVGSLKENPDIAKIVAVCDINLDAANTQASKVNAAVYNDYQKMLKDESVDIALVCLPHFLHCQVGLDILNRGVHLFMEKPMANTVAECRRMIAAAENNDVSLFVGHTHHYRQVMLKAKELVDNGSIGEPKMIYDEVVAYYNWETRKPWFLEPDKAGGGVLFNTSPHQVDHFLHLINGSVAKVKASVQSLRPGQVVDSDTIAFIEYDNGIQGFMSVFSSTKMASPGSLKTRVLGTEGSIQFSAFGNEIELAKLDQVEKINIPEDNSMVDEWRECVGAIRESRQPQTNGVYGHNVVAVLEAMVQSSKSKSEVAPELL